MVQKVAGRSGDHAQVSSFIQPLEHSLCQPSSKWLPFLNQGRIRQHKGTDGLCLSSAVPKIQWVSITSTAPMAIRLWETIAFLTEHLFLSYQFTGEADYSKHQLTETGSQEFATTSIMQNNQVS